MRRLTYNDVVAINCAICDQFNGETNVLNPNNLNSALSVYDSYYNTNTEIAAALFRSLILNHPFSDGNKRTAVAVLYYVLTPVVSIEAVENLALSVAKGEITHITDIANLLYET